MAGPEDFEFAIVAADYTAETFDKVDMRVKKTNDGAQRATMALGKYADRARAGFEKILGPARALAPELDGLTKPIARVAKAGMMLGAAFRTEPAKRASAAYVGAAKAAVQLGNAAGAASSGGLARTAAGLAAVEEGGAAAAVSVGAAAEGLGVLGGAAMLGASSVGTLGAAFVAAEVAGAKFISPFARQGQQLSMTADTIGMAADQLQAFRGASELAGVSADATTGAIASLATTMHRAQYGMDAGAITALGLAGIKTPERGAALDVNAAILQAADAIKAQKSPGSQATLAGALGVSAALPFFRQGSGAIKRDQAQYRASGDVYTDAELAKSKEMSRSLTAFNQASHGMAKGAAMRGVDLVEPGVDAATSAIRGMGGQADAAASALGRLGDAANQLVGATPAAAATPLNQRAGGGARPYVAGGRAPPMAPPPIRSLRAGIGATPTGATMRSPGAGAAMRGRPPSPEQEAIAFFEAKGLSRSAAIGMAAAFEGESGLNPDQHQKNKSHGPGYGIGQWERPRQEDFKAWAGHDIHGSTRQEQMEFAWHELNTRQFAVALGHLQRPDISPGDAASVVSREYERPKLADRAAADRTQRAEALDRVTPAQAVTGEIKVIVDAPAGTKVITKQAGPVGLKVVRTVDFLTQ